MLADGRMRSPSVVHVPHLTFIDRVCPSLGIRWALGQVAVSLIPTDPSKTYIIVSRGPSPGLECSCIRCRMYGKLLNYAVIVQW